MHVDPNSNQAQAPDLDIIATKSACLIRHRRRLIWPEPFHVSACMVHRRPGDPAPADPHEERFLAFGRVFSGVLRQVPTIDTYAQ